jgi:hypothetical protein
MISAATVESEGLNDRHQILKLGKRLKSKFLNNGSRRRFIPLNCTSKKPSPSLLLVQTDREDRLTFNLVHGILQLGKGPQTVEVPFYFLYAHQGGTGD